MVLLNKLIVSACAVTVLSAAVGCSMCNTPISGDPSCIEDSHTSDKSINPAVMAYTAPTIAPCNDVFKPTFRAGDKRITVTGTGKSLDEATADAVGIFLKEASCDYIVAVTRIVSMKTHPTWRFFATTNYTVTFSGIPIYLDKLEKGTLPAAENDKKASDPGLTKDEIIEIIKTFNSEYISKLPQPPPQPQFGMLKLTDINVQIQAKGETPDNAGVVFPVKK